MTTIILICSKPLDIRKKQIHMNLLDPISKIMRTNLVTVGVEDPLIKVHDLFEQNKIHHLPVLDGGKLAGILSKSDFLFFQKGFGSDERDEEVEKFRLKSHKVKEIMTTGLAKMEPDERINVALEIFKENMFHAIPVVVDGRIVGIVTTFDIIQHLANDAEVRSDY